MNIAIFASAFYPHVGGVEELCRQLAHAYIAQGHGCIVLTNRWPRDLPSRETYEGIDVFRLPFRIPEGSLKAQISYRLTHRRIISELIAVLRERRIDIMHVQCVSSNGYYALLAKRALGLPLVVTAQGELTMDAGKLYEKSPFANRVLRELLDEADFITACSKHTLKELENWYGSPLGKRGATIHNGIRLADFESAEPYRHPRPYVLAIGRLVPQKGFDVLIDAYAQAALRSHDLLIAGEGPELAALRAQAQARGLNGTVHFVGRADRKTAVALFKGCSFFVLPSRLEPQGIVNLEAMAAGKGVIASAVGGVPEIVRDAITGLLVPPGDATEMAGALKRVASDDRLRRMLGEAGRETAKSFDWSMIAQEYLSLYSSVTGAADVIARNGTALGAQS